MYIQKNIKSDSIPFAIIEKDSNGYKFAFNGKENIEEIDGWQDYGARMYNRLIGRFPTADPLIVYQQQYSWYSPYQFAGNKPIVAIDLDGLEEFFRTTTTANNNNFQAALELICDCNMPSTKNIYNTIYQSGKKGKTAVDVYFFIAPKEQMQIGGRGETFIIKKDELEWFFGESEEAKEMRQKFNITEEDIDFNKAIERNNDIALITIDKSLVDKISDSEDSELYLRVVAEKILHEIFHVKKYIDRGNQQKDVLGEMMEDHKEYTGFYSAGSPDDASSSDEGTPAKAFVDEVKQIFSRKK